MNNEHDDMYHNNEMFQKVQIIRMTEWRERHDIFYPLSILYQRFNVQLQK